MLLSYVRKSGSGMQERRASLLQARYGSEEVDHFPRLEAQCLWVIGAQRSRDRNPACTI